LPIGAFIQRLPHWRIAESGMRNCGIAAMPNSNGSIAECADHPMNAPIDNWQSAMGAAAAYRSVGRR
jgi:hypothetical protein